MFYRQPIFFQFPVILTVESYCKFVHSVFCSILGKAIWLFLLLPVYVLAQHEWFASLWPY